MGRFELPGGEIAGHGVRRIEPIVGFRLAQRSARGFFSIDRLQDRRVVS